MIDGIDTYKLWAVVIFIFVVLPAIRFYFKWRSQERDDCGVVYDKWGDDDDQD